MTTPTDILREAKILLNGDVQTEVRRRTIIGRCYYAAFNHVKGHDSAKDFQRDKGESVHAALIRHLVRSNIYNIRYAGNKLRGLFRARIKADYHLENPVDRGEETVAYEDADEIMNDILGED